MAKRVKKVSVFDKGWVDEIGEEQIPAGAASEVSNFLDLGDRIELVRGQTRLGDAISGSGKVLGLGVATDVDGTEYIYKRYGTVLQRLDNSTDTWSNILTGLTNNEDMEFTKYRTPAGSFLWFSSPSTGLYRINMAHPSTVTNFYDANKNYKGYPVIEDNRMFMSNILGAETVLRLSYIDADFPYANATSENIGTGDGATLTFTDTLVNPHVVGRSISATDGTETFTDDGMGTLTGSAGGTGTINYVTGAISVTFNAAPAGAQAITCTYQYEEPKSNGVADFTYSSPRTEGQGTFFFQAKNDDPIMRVLPYDGIFYVFHRRSIWTVDLKEDDTGALNKVFRENTGIPNHLAAVATGDGIYYIDDSQETDKKLRLLQYDKTGSKVLPLSISDQVDLSDYNFTDSACIEYGDLIIWACKSSGVTYNDTLIIYNKKWKLIDKMSGAFSCFTIFEGGLYGGSSVNNNVYQIFSGFVNDGDTTIYGSWISNEDDLGSEELKKYKKFYVFGEMATSQELIVEQSYDGDPWVEIGRISGASDYVDASSGAEYGVEGYGDGSYGSGTAVTAYEYARLFDITCPKFQRVRTRFRTEEVGYLNVRIYRYDDIRLKRLRIASKFRG